MKKIIMSILILVILAGCSTNTVRNQNVKSQVINVKNSYIQEVDKKSGQEIAKHLVELASGIPNVNDATAVVIGRYAIVGIDVNSKLERSQVGSIKYSVAESLKKDPFGARAIVVADADTTARLKEISQDIRNGRPVQGVLNELADITGRLMPEIPGDLINPNPKNAPEEPKRNLNRTEQNNLQHQQEQESKGKK
ncbi:MAG: YhcN/YlaJ family sporulation lipoprotein [Bacillota bacterium]|nr:YhcN/YlaJ family sporulation lipoprotein [Bacillota bacterium]MDP4170300.1 YhcN/YlaJ family sporulation lipoprotein [Bacillota bacterium]